MMKHNNNSINHLFEKAALVIAIFFVALIPILVRNYLVEYPMNQYTWYDNQTIFVDTYSVLRANVIILLGIISGFLLVGNQILYKKLSFKDPVVIATMIFAAVTLISHVVSTNTNISARGYIERSEGVWVWLSYIAVFLFLYASNWTEKNIKVLLHTFVGINVFLCIMGILQYFGVHVLLADWMKPIINSTEMKNVTYEGSYSIDYRVILQLFSHYNYVGYYISMSLPIIVSLMIYESDKIKKMLYAVLVIMLLINLLGSSARGGLVAIIVSIPLFLFINRKKLLKNVRNILVLTVIFITVFVGFEIYSGGFITMRIKSTFTSVATANLLQEAKVEDNKISFKLKEHWYDVTVLSAENDIWQLTYELDGKIIEPIGQDQQGAFYFEEEALSGVRNFLSESEGKQYYTIEIYGTPWYFNYNEDQLMYYNVFGKYDNIVKPKSFGFEGREKLGSARGYIWSRAIPLIFDRPWTGYGLDTFAFVFPQNDYVGKYNAYDTTNSVVDKAHNKYIQIAMNSGLIALISYTSLLFILAIRITKTLSKNHFTVVSAIQSGTLIAMFSYFIASFFNDSTVQVSPVFWGLFALAFVVYREPNGNEK